MDLCLNLHASISPVQGDSSVCSSRVGEGGVRVGGHTSWSTNELDTFRPAPEWTQSLFCVAVYLLFSVVRPDLSPLTEMFPSDAFAALGFHASFENA